MVAPSSAMTSTLMAFAPSSSTMAPLALPLVTAVRLDPLPTFAVAAESLTVGVSFTCVCSFATVAVQAMMPEAKVEGFSVSVVNVPV
nr:hypothetical protein [Candidatus Synechococcus spongiarum]